MISRWTRLRLVVSGLVFVVLGIHVGKRAFQLQVNESEELRARAEEQHGRLIEVRPERGRILDRRGNELAATALHDSISCNPRQLLAVPSGVERLAAVLRMDARALARSLEGKRYFAWVKRTVSAEESARVRALGLPGVRFDRESKRHYPAKESGATVIGHSNIDGVGIEGAERAFDSLLRGSGTRLQGMRDGSGREMLLEGRPDRRARAGKDLVLSLDSYLMYVTQTALSAAVKQWNAKGGTSIIMDPRTGEILALASVPTYDPNQPGDAVSKGATKNRAITDILEPGSTLKTFTLAATLEAGKVRATDMFDCQSGRPMFLGKARVRDDHPVGIISAAEVLQRSSNIGTVKIARLLGKQGLYEALLRFGFGRRTGVGLEGEVSGWLRPASKWGDVHFANIAFGQGLAVTPLQMVAGYAAIANGGLYHPPRLTLKVINPDGKEESFPPPGVAPVSRRVVSETTARTMLSIMEGVTGVSGTARRAAIDGYPVAGKTGTAQKVVGGRYGAWIGSFIGIVPANDPRLVIAVIIDEPEPEHRGGMVAAPAFKQIGEAALRYLAVPQSESMLARAAARPGAPGQEGAAAALPPLAIVVKGEPGGKGAPAEGADTAEIGEGPGSDQPLWGGPEELQQEIEILGEDEGTAGATPEVAVASDDDGSMITVPSFVGLSMGEAIRAAREAGVDIEPEGSGVAVTQSPPPGPRERGALCRVSFRPGG
jgi:cell division protein FtsI (penicillin-binding protein 3)